MGEYMLNFVRFFILVLAVTLSLNASNAQLATYAGGSIYDLDPPARQNTDNRVFEQIIKKNDLEQVISLSEGDVLREIARPVGRLALENEDGKISFCTASVIDTDLILTNFHCVPGQKSNPVKAAILWMGYLTASSRKGVAQYKVNIKPIEADESRDFAVLKVEGTPGNEWGRVTFSDATPGESSSLVIIQHPGGSVQYLTRGGCRTASPATKGDDLMHECDTLGGSSGAPIFDNNTRRVIGLHYSAVGLKLNAGKRIAALALHSPTIKKLLENAPALAAEGSLISMRKDLNDLIKSLKKKNGNVAQKFPAQPQSNDLGRVWAAIQNTTSEAVLETFIARSAGTIFAELAMARLGELRKSGSNETGNNFARQPSINNTDERLIRRESAQSSCESLWHERNSIFDQYGYCFRTTRGKRAFSNAGCFRSQNQAWRAMGASNRSRVQEIKSQENARGC